MNVYEVTPKNFRSNGTAADDALIKWYRAPSLEAVQACFPDAAHIACLGPENRFPDVDGSIESVLSFDDLLRMDELNGS